MSFLCLSGYEYIVDIHYYSRDTTEKALHDTLEYPWGRGDSEGQAVKSVEPPVCVDHNKLLGLIVQYELLVSLTHIQLCKQLSPSKLSEEILNFGKGYRLSLVA